LDQTENTVIGSGEARMQREIVVTIYFREEEQIGDNPWLSKRDIENLVITSKFCDDLPSRLELENSDVYIGEEE
jgi:hypothetical protein